MKSKIDWEELAFSPTAMLQRAIVLLMNRIEEAAEKRPEYEVGPHFDQECHTLIDLLLARQNLSPEYVDSPLPDETK